MEEMSRCLRLYRTSYGLRHIPSQLVAVVQSGLHALPYQLEEAFEARDVFIELSRLAISLSQRFKPIANSISTIISLSQCGTAILPPEAIAILHGPEILGRGISNQNMTTKEVSQMPIIRKAVESVGIGKTARGTCDVSTYGCNATSKLTVTMSGIGIGIGRYVSHESGRLDDN